MRFRKGDLVSVTDGPDKGIECVINCDGPEEGHWNIKPVKSDVKLKFLFPKEFEINDLEDAWYQAESIQMIKPILQKDDVIQVMPLTYSGKKNISRSKFIGLTGKIISLSSTNALVEMKTKERTEIPIGLLRRLIIKDRRDDFKFKENLVVVFKDSSAQKNYGVSLNARDYGYSLNGSKIVVNQRPGGSSVEVIRKNVIALIPFKEVFKKIFLKESKDCLSQKDKEKLKSLYLELERIKKSNDFSKDIKKALIEKLKDGIKELNPGRSYYYFRQGGPPIVKPSQINREMYRDFMRKILYGYIESLMIKNNKESKPLKQFGLKELEYSGVFLKPNQIVEIKKDSTCQTKGSQKPLVKKKNYIGLEIELISKCDVAQMVEIFTKNKLGHSVTIATDGSLRSTTTHPYCHELRILFSESSMMETFSKLQKALTECSAAVNDTCGLHVHLDMRTRNPAICYNRLANAYPFISKIVDKKRLTNQYCHAPKTTKLEEAKILNKGRYCAINADSLGKHQTIEVRLHHGSVDLNEIKHWIDTLLSIIKTKGKFKNMETFITGLKEYSKENQEIFRKKLVNFA